MIPLAEAKAHVLERCPALDPGAVALEQALGLVLAETVTALDPVPPFANTAMDGFAVRAADTDGVSSGRPVDLAVVGTLRAGMAPDAARPGAPLLQGEAIRIMTGAPIPPGADAIVMVERTSVSDDGAIVSVLEAARPGDHIRPAGDDVIEGQSLFGPGTFLTPGHLGVLASVSRAEVIARRRPRVGVLSTGDELVAAGAPLEPGQIRDSNRLSLLGLVRDSGFEGVDLGLVRDDETAITRAIEQGIGSCDALLTSGGVSMGDFDFVKVVLDRIGDMRWMQIAIKPAKPFAFGLVEGAHGPVPVFGLPGNPVSSMVSFELLARPALRQMAGFGPDDLDRPGREAIADEPFNRRADGKIHFVRVTCRWDSVDHAYHAAPAGGQGSHQMLPMASAGALAVLPDGPGTAPGELVEVLLLR